MALTLRCSTNDRLIKIWDVESGDEIISLRGNTAKALGLAFSPDGQRIASGGQDGVVRFWNADRLTSDERSRMRAARIVNGLTPHLVRDDVVASIQSDKRLDASMRVVTRTDASKSEYELALRLAISSARLAPDDNSHANMVGMALYRVGNHESAVDQLVSADRAYVAERGDGVPWNLAYYRLGDSNKAHETLLRLDRVMTLGPQNGPDWQEVKLYRDMLREAKEVLGSRNTHEPPIDGDAMKSK